MLNNFFTGYKEYQSKQGYVHGANWNNIFGLLLQYHCRDNVGGNSGKNKRVICECETIVLRWMYRENKEMELK